MSDFNDNSFSSSQVRTVDRTFSQDNKIVTDERRSMSEKTTKQLLFVYSKASKLLIDQ